MTWVALWRAIAPLGSTLLLVGAGYLIGRWQRHQHLDQVERDAWEDGFHACLDSLGIDVDAPSRQLDAAASQTRPDAAYPRWWN